MAAGDGAPADITIDADQLRQFGQMLNRAAEPKKLRRELAKDLRGTLQPAVQKAKSNISGGLAHTSQTNPSPALGPSIARNVRAEVRLSGNSTGARVKVKKTRNVRGFLNAPKLTNRDKWRRPVWGRTGEWTEQIGRPGWFDDPMREDQTRYRAAMMQVLENWARRIARETR